ncbi:hypothetical protein ACF09E_12330 [Streptomyces sp. NPDC014891]
MKIRLTWAVPLGLLLAATVAVLAVYGTHAFTIAGRIVATIF